MPSAEDIGQVVDQYIAAWSSHDLDSLMALLAPDAVVHDPVDGPVYDSEQKIREFYGRGIGPMRSCKLASPVHISGDCHHAAASIYSEVDLGGSIKVIEWIDVMTFDDNGLISGVTAYWGPSNVRAVSP